MERGEVVERDFVGQEVGVLVIDCLDPQQGEVALVLLRRADLAGNGRPRLQAEAANLARRDVNVVRAGKVMVVRAAKEAESVGQHLERPLPVHQPIELHPLLENPKHQVVLLDAGVVAEVLLAGFLDQLGHRHPLEFGDVGVAGLLDLLVAIVDLIADRGPLGGDLLGQRERFVLVVQAVFDFRSPLIVRRGWGVAVVVLVFGILRIGHADQTPEGKTRPARKASAAGQLNCKL